jgi:hypothetical protein
MTIEQIEKELLILNSRIKLPDQFKCWKEADKQMRMRNRIKYLNKLKNDGF